MSLMSSLYTGQTGLAANSLDLSVIGDNIANANTIGFKGSRAAFEDALTQTVMNGQLGTGTQLLAVQRLLQQGALANTGIATDLALDGNGFFVLKGAHGGVDGTWLTRAGQFTVDNDGYMVNLEGLRVQGFPADATGVVQPGIDDLLIGNASSPPRATTSLTLKGNLSADAVVPPAWDPANPDTTSNFSQTETVYDSLGEPHELTIYYRKTGAGAWEWHAMADGGGLTGGTAGTPTEVATGTLTFDTSGALTAVTQSSTFNPINAVNPQALSFNFGTPVGGAATGLDGLTQFGGDSTSTFLSQDGWSAGTLSSISINEKGEVVGAFSNGQTRVIGQVAVGNVSAPDQLVRSGGNLYSGSPSAGDLVIGQAGTGGRGAIAAGALEQSNVDLATEFVKMIAAQRGFQANSKTISTADQLLQELMALKR
jgi:flagellar hook protein FlgE